MNLVIEKIFFSGFFRGIGVNLNRERAMPRLSVLAISGVMGAGTIAGIVAFSGNITSAFSNSVTLWDRFINNKEGTSKIRVVSRIYTDLPIKVEQPLTKNQSKDNVTANYSVNWTAQITVQAVNMKGILLDDVSLISPGRLKSADGQDFVGSTNISPEKPYTFTLYYSFKYNKFATQMLDAAIKEYGSMSEAFKRSSVDVFFDNAPADVEILTYCYKDNIFSKDDFAWKYYGYRTMLFKLTFSDPQYDRYCLAGTMPIKFGDMRFGKMLDN